ncbi:unnamed protein product [Bemisia tabaci]|uniref:Ionotropic receptor n=1 Tax=Bemisia tabaci TaxID=7038 RepID=A0A9P0AIX8_BEMTA|nr:unnamed protein product [Bemisia tabaci]
MAFGLHSCFNIQHATSDKWESLSSFAFSVCQSVVKKSEQTLFYTVELNSDPLFMHFVQLLHAAAIQTIVISHHSKVTSSVFTHQSKNFIFIVNDMNELFSLIFHTIAEPEPFDLNCKKSVHAECNQTDSLNHSAEILPRHCLKIDKRFLWFEEIQNCSKIIEIKSAELEDGSILSDEVFNATQGLYVNKIWNSKNHLIFFLKNAHQHNTSEPFPLQILKDRKFERQAINKHSQDMHGRIAFCFKFFWRFFKGRKAIICHPQGCEKYDSFTENLISLQSETDENFFDFSWDDMHGKPVKVFYDYYNTDDTLSSLLPGSSPIWFSLHEMAVKHFGSSVNCSIIEHLIDPKKIKLYNFDVEGGLKYGIDLYLFGDAIILGESDNPRVDYLMSIDTGALCFATPHSGFMPQGLVIFKSFTPIVWILTLITISTFILIQCAFQYTQCASLGCLYSEAQKDHIRGTSSILTIYAYFVCGSPPSLNLGRLLTGNILFSIFSFSTIIISTAFLGSMTTLLSKRVQYPEINSLKTLEESDLFIQLLPGEGSVAKGGACFQNMSESLRRKLEPNYEFYWFDIAAEIFLYSQQNSSDQEPTNSSTSTDVGDLFAANENVSNNMRSIMATDALLLTIPFTSNPRESVTIDNVFLRTAKEYHLVRECFLTYPIIFQILRNSFFFDELNRVYARLLEGGHAKKILYDLPTDFMNVVNFSEMKDKNEPRVYNLNDLQSAFIGLIVGLLISFLAFIGELTIHQGYFHDNSVVKLLRRVKVPQL